MAPRQSKSVCTRHGIRPHGGRIRRSTVRARQHCHSSIFSFPQPDFCLSRHRTSIAGCIRLVSPGIPWTLYRCTRIPPWPVRLSASSIHRSGATPECICAQDNFRDDALKHCDPRIAPKRGGWFAMFALPVANIASGRSIFAIAGATGNSIDQSFRPVRMEEILVGRCVSCSRSFSWQWVLSSRRSSGAACFSVGGVGLSAAEEAPRNKSVAVALTRDLARSWDVTDLKPHFVSAALGQIDLGRAQEQSFEQLRGLGALESVRDMQQTSFYINTSFRGETIKTATVVLLAEFENGPQG